ncbi:MAG: ABC transporter permease [Bacteroidetes bacterium]|nr:MAG: ABC transporter permease [Bacteroidota bacterium]MBL1143458.1 ABC transporter permease [Bacteroidota bacterium]MCB0802722.1 ABC transporter permease [Flavobacteriales bacterium]NOG56262.1 ABC transporter permease [Bacteroidota bacterium]
MNTFYHIGQYFMLMARVFQRPKKIKLYRKQIIYEINSLGLGSFGIISIISVFIGAVITLQTASNIDSALIPAYTVGFTARQSMILEFSPTIIALILAGKVGSNITSEIGLMRVTEQIDALEIMGVNSASYLIVPKIIAAVFINPFLVIWSMFIGIIGGYLVAQFSGVVSTDEYIYGIQYAFKPFSIVYAMIKTVFFAYIITSIPAYYGYYVKGGAIAVGSASTKGVVSSSIVILIVNYVITQLLLI